MSLVPYVGQQVISRAGRYGLTRLSGRARAGLRYATGSALNYAYHNPDRVVGLARVGVRAAASKLSRWWRRGAQQRANRNAGYQTRRGVLGSMTYKKSSAPMRLRGGKGSSQRYSPSTQATASQGIQVMGRDGDQHDKVAVTKGKFNFKFDANQLLKNMCPVWEYETQNVGAYESGHGEQMYFTTYSCDREEIRLHLNKILSTDVEPNSTHAFTTNGIDPTTAVRMNWTTPVQFVGGSRKIELVNECNNQVTVKVFQFVANRNHSTTLPDAWQFDLMNSATNNNAVNPVQTLVPTPGNMVGSEPGEGIPIAMRRTWKMIGKKVFSIAVGGQVDCTFHMRPQRRYVGDWFGDDISAAAAGNGLTSSTENYIRGATYAYLIIAYGQLNHLITGGNTLDDGACKIGYRQHDKFLWRSVPLNKSFSRTVKHTVLGGLDAEYGHINPDTEVNTAYAENA